MATRGAFAFLLTLVPYFLFFYPTNAHLSVDYYSKTCPNAEEIVRKEMIQIFSVAPSLAGPFLRLHFHDCFVRVTFYL
jgi:peroxidase